MQQYSTICLICKYYEKASYATTKHNLTFLGQSNVEQTISVPILVKERSIMIFLIHLFNSRNGITINKF